MCLSRSQSLFPAEIFFSSLKPGGGGGMIVHTIPHIKSMGDASRHPAPLYSTPLVYQGVSNLSFLALNEYTTLFDDHLTSHLRNIVSNI